jgi:triosephosphate isomerase
MSHNTIYTGEISGEQLKDFDIKWVIVGQSERRTVFNEHAECISAKILKAQTLNLNVMYCVGESIE